MQSRKPAGTRRGHKIVSYSRRPHTRDLMPTMLRKTQYLPCIPTRRTEVPAGPGWLHEIKHDGYRLIVQREGKRVRLFTRRGHDWSDRYPLITEAALRLSKQSSSLMVKPLVLAPDGSPHYR